MREARTFSAEEGNYNEIEQIFVLGDDRSEHTKAGASNSVVQTSIRRAGGPRVAADAERTEKALRPVT